jgi:hypothetical protein
MPIVAPIHHDDCELYDAKRPEPEQIAAANGGQSVPNLSVNARHNAVDPERLACVL